MQRALSLATRCIVLGCWRTVSEHSPKWPRRLTPGTDFAGARPMPETFGGNGRRRVKETERTAWHSVLYRTSHRPSYNSTRVHFHVATVRIVQSRTPPSPNSRLGGTRWRVDDDDELQRGRNSWIVFLENLPSLAHPGPPPVWVNAGVGFEPPPPLRELYQQPANVPCVLRCPCGGGAD